MASIGFVLWYFFGEREATAATVGESGVQEVEVTVKGGYSPDDLDVQERAIWNLFKDDNAPRKFSEARERVRTQQGLRERFRRGLEESAHPLVVPQQRLDLGPESRVVPTGLVQVAHPLGADLPTGGRCWPYSCGLSCEHPPTSPRIPINPINTVVN